MQRAIITGATSMLGIALIEECIKHIKHNVEVVPIVRPDSNKLYRLPVSKLVKTVECSLDSLINLTSLTNVQGAVFYHFGWSETGLSRNNNIFSQSDNIKYTLDAVYVASLLNCKSFIGAGSQAEYGSIEEGKIGPHSCINPSTPYGISKYAAGKLAMILCKRLGIECIWTRVFSVYGKYDKSTTMISTALEKILNGERTEFTKGIQLWDYLYSEDAGRAFYLLGDKGKDQSIYCVGSGKARPLYEYIRVIESLSNPKYGMGIGKIPYDENSVMNLCADISNLTEDTGFSPLTSFEEGMRRTIQHFISCRTK